MAPKKDGSKRKAEPSGSDSDAVDTKKSKANSSDGKAKVNPKRWRALKDGEVGKGPVIYWCATNKASWMLTSSNVKS